MSKRSVFHRLRDGAFVVSAFAMVLYAIVANHDPDRPEARRVFSVGDEATTGDPRLEHRWAFAAPGASAP